VAFHAETAYHAPPIDAHTLEPPADKPGGPFIARSLIFHQILVLNF